MDAALFTTTLADTSYRYKYNSNNIYNTQRRVKAITAAANEERILLRPSSFGQRAAILGIQIGKKSGRRWAETKTETVRGKKRETRRKCVQNKYHTAAALCRAHSEVNGAN